MGRLQKRRKTGNKKKQKTRDSQPSSQVKSESSKYTDSSAVAVKEKKRQSLSAGGKGPPKNGGKGSLKSSPSAGKKRKNYLDTVTQFLREVMMELKKVTWPSRKQTTGSTVVMIILVMIISLFLGMVDMGLYRIIKIVLQ